MEGTDSDAEANSNNIRYEIIRHSHRGVYAMTMPFGAYNYCRAKGVSKLE